MTKETEENIAKEAERRRAMGLPKLTQRASKQLYEMTESDVEEYLNEVREIAQKIYRTQEEQEKYLESVRKKVLDDIAHSVKGKKRKASLKSDSILAVDSSGQIASIDPRSIADQRPMTRDLASESREQLGKAVPTISQTAFQNPWDRATRTTGPSSRERSDTELKTRKEVERVENLSSSVNRLVIEQQETTKLLNELRDAVKALEERTSQGNRQSRQGILGRAAEAIGGSAVRSVIGGLAAGALGYALTDIVINQITGQESGESGSATPPGTEPATSAPPPPVTPTTTSSMAQPAGTTPQPIQISAVSPGERTGSTNVQLVSSSSGGLKSSVPAGDSSPGMERESPYTTVISYAPEIASEPQRQVNPQAPVSPKSLVPEDSGALPKSPVSQPVGELVTPVNTEANVIPKSPVSQPVDELPKSPVPERQNNSSVLSPVEQIGELPKSPVATQVDEEKKKETMNQLFGTDLSLRAKKITFKGDEIKFLGDVTPTAKGSAGKAIPFVGGIPGAVSGGMGMVPQAGPTPQATQVPQAAAAGAGGEGTAEGITPPPSETPSAEVSDLKFAPGVDKRIKKDVAEKVKKVESGSGKELTITSGFRDPARNAAAGGARNSAHTRANAVDIRFRGNEQDTIKLIEEASQAGIGGIGVYGPGRVHLDTESKRVWGPDFTARSIPEWAKPALQAHMTGQRQSEAAGGGGGEADATPVSGETGGSVGATSMETEGGGGTPTGAGGTATPVSGEPAATMETAPVTSAGAALIGASTEAEVQDRIVPQQPETAVGPNEVTPSNPALTTSEHSHDPNDPGPVEPDDAAERYFRLFNMAA